MILLKIPFHQGPYGAQGMTVRKKDILAVLWTDGLPQVALRDHDTTYSVSKDTAIDLTHEMEKAP